MYRYDTGVSNGYNMAADHGIRVGLLKGAPAKSDCLAEARDPTGLTSATLSPYPSCDVKFHNKQPTIQPFSVPRRAAVAFNRIAGLRVGRDRALFFLGVSRLFCLGSF